MEEQKLNIRRYSKDASELVRILYDNRILRHPDALDFARKLIDEKDEDFIGALNRFTYDYKHFKKYGKLSFPDLG